MSEPSGDLRALVEQIAKALVDTPDQVSVNQVESEQSTLLELTVAPNDLGKVIGKQGAVKRMSHCGRQNTNSAFNCSRRPETAEPTNAP